MLGNRQVATWLVASQVVLSSIELVSELVSSCDESLDVRTSVVSTLKRRATRPKATAENINLLSAGQERLKRERERER
jgi:hypothetical protein